MSSVVQQRALSPQPPSHTVLPEKQFADSLRLERRRAERTGNVFLLALIDLPANSSATRQEGLAAVATALCPSIRETDIVGWYQQGLTIGVIFTLLHHASKLVASDAIRGKVGSIIGCQTGAQASEMRVSYHFFPETNGDETNGDTRRDHPAVYSEAAFGQASRGARIVKRVMDVGGSLALLLLFAPLWVVIAAIIKMTSKGPVLFKQTRVGRYGRHFTFLKFRSMHVDNDDRIHREYVSRLIAGENAQASSGPPEGVFKIVNDPRVTKVGRILRRSSFDELPQLFNVLKGEMSLIGPRPPLPYEVEKYEVWHRRRLMVVKPGITGLWQVNGRSRTTFDEMVRMDIRYIDQASVWLDLKILIKTPLVMVSGEGGY